MYRQACLHQLSQLGWRKDMGQSMEAMFVLHLAPGEKRSVSQVQPAQGIRRGEGGEGQVQKQTSRGEGGWSQDLVLKLNPNPQPQQHGDLHEIDLNEGQ